MPWTGKIRLGLVCDEEGMMIGIKHFISAGHADDVTACLVPEPEENNLCLSMKGAIRAIVRVRGRMAHGAMPLTGINPNTRLARIILAFERFEAEEKKRCGADPFLGLPSITFTVLHHPRREARRSSTSSPGKLTGMLTSARPWPRTMTPFAARFAPSLPSCAAADPDFKAEIDFIEDRPVVGISRDEPIARISARGVPGRHRKEPVWNGVPGATDGTFLSSLKGIPCLVNGPGPRHIPHQTDEYVDIDELEECARIYVLSASPLSSLGALSPARAH